MAKVIITVNGNEVEYDAHECEAKDFAAIVNATLYHLEVEFKNKGEDINEILSGIEQYIDKLKTK